MFPNMINSTYPMEPQPAASLKDHRSQLHLQSLSNNSHSSYSTRIPSSGSSPTSSESSSAFFSNVNSPSSNPNSGNNQINPTSSFKFSLLNTVRKAFKKNSMSEASGKDANHMGSQGNLNKITTQPGKNSPNSPVSPTYSESQQGRNRSMTFDSSGSSAALASSAFKQQFKQLQQDGLARQNENGKISSRKLFKSEKVLAFRIN